jgi:hypothetical protein
LAYYQSRYGALEEIDSQAGQWTVLWQNSQKGRFRLNN